MQRFFQIGFNKCATTSLYRLFAKSRVPSVKHTGKRTAQIWNKKPLDLNAQRVINRNMKLGKPPLEGLEGIQAFFDMEYAMPTRTIENFKKYQSLYKAYPDALFLLNTRDKWKWLRSRALHSNGSYLLRTAHRLDCSGLDVLNHWKDEYDRHHAEVRAFFADKPDNFCEFNIDEDPIIKVVRFARKGKIRLQPRNWHVFNETDDDKKKAGKELVKALFMSPDMLNDELVATFNVANAKAEQLVKLTKAAQDLPDDKVVKFPEAKKNRSA